MDYGSEVVVPIPPDMRTVRADKAIAALMEGFSRSQLQKVFAAGRVWRDDEALAQSDKVRGGDVITVSIPSLEPIPLEAVEIPLEVVFEDRHLIVVNKAPGMVVHPGNGTGVDTLVHALLHHCKGQLSGIGGSERPGIVHRLDKETSGLLVAAKTNEAFQSLAGQFADRTTSKVYEAIVCGHPQPEEAWIDLPIGRHPVRRTRMAVSRVGRNARSHYKVTARSPAGFARIRVTILTGRTHQIRVHLSHLGHPLAGDLLYGFRPDNSAVEFPRVMLHAASLAFTHPTTGIRTEFAIAPPEDFESAISW